MIDIHCHILPGMDDGPQSLEEALEMCREASADGVRTIVATPHLKPGTYEFAVADVTEKVRALQEALIKEGLDIRILPGAEVSFSPELPVYVQQGHLTINNNGRYFLIEFPPVSVPPNWDTFLLDLLHSGKVPIIAHPERNAWFMDHPEALSSAVGRGVMVQITAMSITGVCGGEARDFSVYLLRNNLVHAIASDGHSADLRPPVLSEAVGLVSDLVGPERAEALVTSIPKAIIEGRNIPFPEQAVYALPARGRGKKWFQRLFR